MLVAIYNNDKWPVSVKVERTMFTAFIAGSASKSQLYQDMVPARALHSAQADVFARDEQIQVRQRWSSTDTINLQVLQARVRHLQRRRMHC